MITSKKRGIVFLFIGLFLVSIISGLVSAEDISTEATQAAEALVTGATGFFGTLLAPLFGEKEMMSRVFFALLLGMIIFSIISTLFSDSSKTLQWSITGMITALALLGLPSGFLEAVRTSYGAMGATILTVIPFVIILAFSIKANNLLVARVTWLIYSVYYLAMYLFKISSDQVGWFTAESIPYMAGFIAGIGIFLFIPAIRDVIFKGKIEGLTESGMQKAAERKARLKIESERLRADE
ncbi:MAG: hypothetical protein OEL87_01470 [Nanoarchaeota archaeon]|nr:hypothetical protein [Nanoarchaeota archaeon]